MNLEMQNKVLDIVNNISGSNLDHIDLNGNFKDELTLDSIQVVELFAQLENEFQIELPLAMMMVKNTGEFMSMLEHELGKHYNA